VISHKPPAFSWRSLTTGRTRLKHGLFTSLNNYLSTGIKAAFRFGALSTTGYREAFLSFLVVWIRGSNLRAARAFFARQNVACQAWRALI
jgi:hypothetical protein